MVVVAGNVVHDHIGDQEEEEEVEQEQGQGGFDFGPWGVYVNMERVLAEGYVHNYGEIGCIVVEYVCARGNVRVAKGRCIKNDEMGARMLLYLEEWKDEEGVGKRKGREYKPQVLISGENIVLDDDLQIKDTVLFFWGRDNEDADSASVYHFLCSCLLSDEYGDEEYEHSERIWLKLAVIKILSKMMNVQEI